MTRGNNSNYHKPHRKPVRRKCKRVNGLLLICGIAYIAGAALTAGVFGVQIVQNVPTRLWFVAVLVAAGLFSIFASVRWKW